MFAGERGVGWAEGLGKWCSEATGEFGGKLEDGCKTEP